MDKPQDFKQKQPSKTEKMIYELFHHTQRMEQSLWTTTSMVTALAYILDVKPEKVAELLTKDHEKIKEYSTKVNEEIAKLEKEKKEQAEKVAAKANEGKEEK